MGPPTSASSASASACGGAARAQMDLNIAGGRQDGGDRVRVLLVDRRDELIEIGFRHAGHAQEQGADGQLGDDAQQARQALPLEHGLQLVRRAGQQHGHRAGFLHPLAGRGAAVVGQDGGAFDHEGLALVDLRHLAPGLARNAAPAPRRFRPNTPGLRPSARATASRVTSSSVGPRPPERITMGERDRACRTASARRSRSSPITHLATTSTPRSFSSRGEIERIGVDALRRQHLRADRDDFRVHQTRGRPLIPTSTR